LKGTRRGWSISWWTGHRDWSLAKALCLIRLWWFEVCGKRPNHRHNPV
jgi:hypothetical protein